MIHKQEPIIFQKEKTHRMSTVRKLLEILNTREENSISLDIEANGIKIEEKIQKWRLKS